MDQIDRTLWTIKAGDLVYWGGVAVGEIVEVDESDSRSVRVKVTTGSAPWLDIYTHLSIYTP
jgi:hypothetical protein